MHLSKTVVLKIGKLTGLTKIIIIIIPIIVIITESLGYIMKTS